MKLVLHILIQIFRWIFVIAILLFSLATFMGKSYLQTAILVLAVAALIYWPNNFSKTWSKTTGLLIRFAFITILIVSNFILFKPAPKSSIYTEERYKNELIDIYDQKMNNWPDDTEDIFILTEYGKVHVLACGSMDNPPLLMIHAASMGAHSWAENLPPLQKTYRIYSIDNIGEGNKSELKDAQVYPNSSKEIADLLALLADSLGVNRSPLFGASNGGFIALNYALHYPERVESLALFGPMGLTQLTNNSILMLGIASMYPFQFIRNFVTRWAIGTDAAVNQKYGDWFDCILKGTMSSVAGPVPMSSEQKQGMEAPILLFLGTEDAIVGDVNFAKHTAEEFPNIRIEVLKSGHLIAVEQAVTVNKIFMEFLESDAVN